MCRHCRRCAVREAHRTEQYRERARTPPAPLLGSCRIQRGAALRESVDGLPASSADASWKREALYETRIEKERETERTGPEGERKRPIETETVCRRLPANICWHGRDFAPPSVANVKRVSRGHRKRSRLPSRPWCPARPGPIRRTNERTPSPSLATDRALPAVLAAPRRFPSIDRIRPAKFPLACAVVAAGSGSRAYVPRLVR